MHVIVDIKNNGYVSDADVKLNDLKITVDHTRKQKEALHYETELQASAISKILNLVDIASNRSNGNRFKVWRCTPCLE